LKKLIVITGPTTSGKTETAIALALRYQTEIISTDSRQFYRELEIGTAKPDLNQLKAVHHHFINSLSVYDEYSAGKYEQDALQLIEQLFQKNKILIAAGGSGLFIQALLYGFDRLPAADPGLRDELNCMSLRELQKLLSNLDPDYFHRIDQFNPRRLIRAIEVCKLTGKPYSSLLHYKKANRNFDFLLIGLDVNREELYRRIDNRVNDMVQQGLKAEALSFYEFRHLPALKTTGYLEWIPHFQGIISESEAIRIIKRNTRHYAKRQLTWFRKMKDLKWLRPDNEILFRACDEFVVRQAGSD